MSRDGEGGRGKDTRCSGKEGSITTNALTVCFGHGRKGALQGTGDARGRLHGELAEIAGKGRGGARRLEVFHLREDVLNGCTRSRGQGPLSPSYTGVVVSAHVSAHRRDIWLGGRAGGGTSSYVAVLSKSDARAWRSSSRSRARISTRPVAGFKGTRPTGCRSCARGCLTVYRGDGLLRIGDGDVQVLIIDGERGGGGRTEADERGSDARERGAPQKRAPAPPLRR